MTKTVKAVADNGKRGTIYKWRKCRVVRFFKP